MSKVFRLNPVSTETAANYLSSLGAQMSRVRQIEITRGEAASAGTSELSSQVSQTKQFLSEVETLSPNKVRSWAGWHNRWTSEHGHACG